MIEKPGSDEPLTWGVIANVSRDVFTRQHTDAERPGTRHFVPGAKVWVMPGSWDPQRYVVGARRQTGGRGLIRLVMNTGFLVNYRVKPVYSPAVYAAMGQPVEIGTAPRLYESREEAQQTVDSCKWAQTRSTHFALESEPSLMHHADETCEFCDGRDAARAGLDINPHEAPVDHAEGSIGWWGSDHGLWRCGWLVETHHMVPSRITDLGVYHLALARRKLRSAAGWLARDSMGRTATELESDGIGRSRLRFVRGDYQPRLLDGVVHAWLDEDDRVVRTQSG